MRWGGYLVLVAAALGCGRVVVDGGSEGDGGSGDTSGEAPPGDPGDVWWEWQGGASGDKHTEDIVVDPDGCAIVAGNMETDEGWRTWLAKLGPSGSLLWSQQLDDVRLGYLAVRDRERFYGAGWPRDAPDGHDIAVAAFLGDGTHEFTRLDTVDAGTGDRDSVSDLEIGRDGELYLAGTSRVSIDDETPRAWVQRRTWQDGSVVWTWDEGERFSAVAGRGPEEGVYACVGHYHDPTYQPAGRIWALDSDGEETWSVALPDTITSCTLAAPGDWGVLALARIDGPSTMRGWVRRYEANSDEEWTLGHIPTPSSFAAAPDGTWALAGVPGDNRFDHSVTKLDPDALELWRWTATEPELGDLGIQRVAMDPTGAPIVFAVVVTDTDEQFLVRKHAP